MVLLAAFAGCCADYSYREATYSLQVEPGTVLRMLRLEPALEEKILALDPDRISEADVAQVLSQAPAPRIISIHGGTLLAHLHMRSFAAFLIGMGYPECKIRDPRDGAYSFSCYASSEHLAGLIAWYYEKEGLRPLIVGHSQGGMQAIKVLHRLAGSFGRSIAVRDPITGRREDRDTIIDPLTGQRRPVVGLVVPYATAACAGGITRLLPNQWRIAGKLRKIPDCVEEFTGFYLRPDLLGGDWLGFGPGNLYHAVGKAKVRTVRLPYGRGHCFVPSTSHLAERGDARAWIDRYVPGEAPAAQADAAPRAANILWAAEVWTSIKRHWCRELQRLIHARRELSSGR